MASWIRSKIQRVEGRLDLNNRPVPKPTAAPAAPGAPTPQNLTLLQGFEWHTPEAHWKRLSGALQSITDVGVTSLWLPPGCKANSFDGNGYDCYDLWDLGEFDQKWRKSTKWGSRQELDELIAKAKSVGIKIVWDAVLNHKTAGDATEECWAVEVEKGDRRVETCLPKKIEPWIKFEFPGRGDRYSSFKWNSEHFSGTDYDQRTQGHAIYKIVDPPESHPRPGQPIDENKAPRGWSGDVDDGMGNYDYLMFSDIDYKHPDVREDVLRWGEWMVNEVGVDGFRLDAVPHISWRFMKGFIEHVQAAAKRQNRELFLVGEYLNNDVEKLIQWTDRMGAGVRAVDFTLCRNFAKISGSKTKIDPDLRKIYRGSLASTRPDNAVTYVTSHDTQPGQAVETAIAPFFKPLAYALLLLRYEGLPCVFYGDLYGIQGPHAEPATCSGKLPILMLSRKVFAYGEQSDYFNSRNSIGWVRHGTWDRRDGCAVVMSIGSSNKITMNVGADKAGQTWTDILGNVSERVAIDGQGNGTFACGSKSVSVYVREDAPGRREFATHCEPHKFNMQ